MEICNIKTCQAYDETIENHCLRHRPRSLNLSCTTWSDNFLKTGQIERQDICGWEFDQQVFADGAWETTCGESWYIPEGTPTENGMKFCPMCGKDLVEIGGSECI